jgi:hypothetical protein
MTVAKTSTDVGDGYSGGRKHVWTLTTADPNGEAVGPEELQHTDVCIQAVGTNWGGAVLKLQGSNDGTNWFDMTNAAGGATLSFSATDGGKQAIERPFYYRPALTTTGTLAVVVVTVCARRNPFSRSFK